MSYRDGYFQIEIQEDGTYIKLFPPTKGGNPIMISSISNYFGLIKLEADLTLCNRALLSLETKPIRIKLKQEKIEPQAECFDLQMSSDRMEVVTTFFPPTTNGQKLTREDIMAILVRNGIKYGICKEAIEQHLINPQYNMEFVIAKGVKPTLGTESKITYHFIDKVAKPKVNEDGSVNFHELDNINHVLKGEVLATLQPAIQGTPGIDVLGHETKPKLIKNLILKKSNFVSISEDGLSLIADVSGHVTKVDDQVFVSNVYEVPADVNASTGDIEYDGSVLVKGNVLTGFSVKAEGDIFVQGVVEGATLISKGQIVLGRGIQGMNKGLLQAQGDIITKFIESSTVKAGGSITTECILHSRVAAKGDIVVNGKKGYVTGGEVRSGTMIDVKTAGSTMGTHTLLEVGIDPELIEEFNNLEVELNDIGENLQKSEQALNLLKKKKEKEGLSPEKQQYFQMVTRNCILLNASLKTKRTQYEELEKKINQNSSGVIKVSSVAYSGVKIIISNAVLFIRKDTHHSRFVKEAADIRIKSL